MGDLRFTSGRVGSAPGGSPYKKLLKYHPLLGLPFASVAGAEFPDSKLELSVCPARGWAPVVSRQSGRTYQYIRLDRPQIPGRVRDKKEDRVEIAAE